MVTRPLQETTTTLSARQTWFACWPPYLRNRLHQLFEWLRALVGMVIIRGVTERSYMYDGTASSTSTPRVPRKGSLK